MCSLSGSILKPADGEVTICERNGDLLTRPASSQFPSGSQDAVLQGIKLPNVSKPAEIFSSLVSEESARSAFLPERGDIAQWKRVWFTFRENGLCGMLEEMCEKDTDYYNWIVSGLASGCLSTIKMMSYIQGSVYPHFLLSREDVINEFSSARDWKTSDIKAFAWHPHTSKCAVAWNDNSIKIFTADSEIVTTLKHRHQQGVSCLEWMPLSAGVLAVGCQAGIIIWNLDPSAPTTRPSPSCSQVLRHESNSPITTLAWDPRGRLLISGSAWDTSMMVWDVPRETCVTLGRRGGGGVSLLRWSPDNCRVLAATPSQIFRVWETQHWTCERWTQISGRLKAACWSPDGRFLIFSSENDPSIYCLDFNSKGVNLDTSQAAVKCADLSQVAFDSDQGETYIGGSIQDLSWDPSGERLAVLFKEDETASNDHIAVFNVSLRPTLQLTPIGFVQGEPNERPQLIQFQPSFNAGALLAVCYASGKVRFIPFFFIPTQILTENRGRPFQVQNGSTVHSQELYSI